MVRLTPPMSSDVKIQEWAEKSAQDFHDKWETGMSGAAFRDLVRALLAAEQRGRKAGIEEAAKVAEELPIGDLIKTTATDLHLLWKYSSSAQARSIAAAIRSLGEKP